LNSIWNKNRASFTARFPSLAQMFSSFLNTMDAENTLSFWSVQKAKNGSITAVEDGTQLHSSYNPEKEALQTVQKSDFQGCTAAVFCGFGLGYTPAAYAEAYPGRTLVIVEPDPAHFFAALTLIDWTPVFACPSCIIALACPAETVIPLIEQAGIAHSAFFSVPSQTAHARNYFETVRILIDRNRRKDEINTATLERFSKRWMKNSCTNIIQYGRLDGVNIYAGRAAALPFTLIAAGPSLEDILPYLAEIKKRSVIVCVDTALRACLRAGTEPDFIVIADPQYYAYRHIAGLSAPSSVLITESAVYPAVYRFPCRKYVLCSSLFPTGQWFEKRLGKKGDLGAGGSVASTAWNFAYLAGGRDIFTAGLDLSFPEKKTHIKGSTFEQEVHSYSMRTRPAETESLPALFSAAAEYGTDYTGKPVLTDSRMKMFAWWFESRLASCPAARTYTFCKKGLLIPGITPVNMPDFLAKPDITARKTAFFTQSEENVDAEHPSQKEFEAAFSGFKSGLSGLYDTACEALHICERALSGPSSNSAFTDFRSRLSVLDNKIAGSSFKEIASLIFPTERQLAQRISMMKIPADPVRAAETHSLLIYTEICRAVKEYLTLLAAE
jgi:hypothetical protein